MALGANYHSFVRPTRANGATQTFRRSSTANNASQRESSQSGMGTMGSTTFQAGIQPPSHHTSNPRNSSNVEDRYSKEQLFDLYRPQDENVTSNINMNDLFLEWNPKTSNQIVNGGWGKADDQTDDVMGPDICWDKDGSSHPLGLLDMTEDEIQVSRMTSTFRRLGLLFVGLQKLGEFPD